MGADRPSGATVFPPTIDGRQIFDGSANYEHSNDPTVNAEIDRISLETDLVQAGKDWAALDKKVMEQAPYIPNPPAYRSKVFFTLPISS